MSRYAIRITLVLLSMVMLAAGALAQDEEIVASLQRLEGIVQVTQATSGETVKGRNGLLLRGGDTVETAEESRATVKFRDGSEVRLFQNTDFVVEVQEFKGKERVFKFNLFMKLGALWGNFVKQRQVAQIGSPTATIGIKGTTLRLRDREGEARVALTEGLIEVDNARTAVTLEPGQRLTDFTRTDDLAEKIVPIPFKLEVKTGKRELEFPNNQPEELFLTIQMVDIESSDSVSRAGRLYLRSNYDRIVYPPDAALDQRGFARVRLLVQPPEPADAALNGNVYIWALLDNEEADDTAEGRVLVRIPVPEGEERVKVEAETGEGKRVR